MSTAKSIKRARWALKQADIALKEADDALNRRAVTEADEARIFLHRAFGLPDDIPKQADTPNGLRDAALRLREYGTRAFRVGDEIEAYNTFTGLARWAVIGINADEVEGGLTLTLQNTVPEIGRSFDAPGLAHPWGRNCWNLCSLREWLNDAFIQGFSVRDRDCIQRVRKKTYSFSDGEYIHTTDRVFLLSASEAGFEIDGERIRDEGKAYPYYSSGDEARQLTTKDGKEISWLLRSPHPWHADRVHVVHPSGDLSNDLANTGHALAMVCVIG